MCKDQVPIKHSGAANHPARQPALHPEHLFSLGRRIAQVCLALSVILLTSCGDTPQKTELNYPETKTVEHTDLYFGQAVSDPYRWLEDDLSDETADWVARQNEVTRGYLDQIPYRDELASRFAKLLDYPTESPPFKEGSWIYFYRNNGTQNHSVLMRQDDNGREEIFIDPNQFSEDATTSLAGVSFSVSGRFLAYATSSAGSDWRTVYVIEAETKKELNPPLKHVKFSGLSWVGDEGFYYSSYEPPQGSALSAKVDQHLLYFHTVDADQSSDKLIFGAEPTEQRRYISGRVSEDQQYLAIEGAQTTAGNDLKIARLDQLDRLVILQETFSADTRLIASEGDAIFLYTNHNAPNGRVVRATLNQPRAEQWVDVIPETDAPLEVATGAGYLFAHYLVDARSRLYQYTMSGQRLREIPLPGLGSASLPRGKESDEALYYRFTNYSTPSTIYRLDPESGESRVYFRPEIAFDPEAYVSTQVFYSSRDGTQVPMIITHRKDRDPSVPAPLMLYGYGGFDISLTPSFSSSVGLWLSLGGIYAVPNLRGGGEYGKAWHLSGTKLQKQNVFEDFIAAAEYLIDQGYTDSNKLAIRGRSNGGLLVGAVMTQRPDLMKVALPGVGVMDMLRYHRFTAGAGWAYDYGTSEDNAEMFEYLKHYSPVHSLKPGVKYPATLVTTADHDDRVVPAHSFKFAATLQASHAGDTPTLIRIETGAGHGAGTSLAKRIQQTADEYAFTLYNLGVTQLEPIRGE
jgi:prolyl oligopeptidase